MPMYMDVVVAELVEQRLDEEQLKPKSIGPHNHGVLAVAAAI